MLLRNATHVLIAATALSIPLAVLDGSLFAWHPACMALGFLGFMAEGVLASISFRSLEGNERLCKVWVHLAWQAAAVGCILAGFAAIYQNKVNHGKPHFQTLHGKFGVATFSAALLAAVGGVVSFRKAGLITKLPEGLQPKVKWAHRSAGVLVWLLSLVTVELALTHKSVWKGWVSHLWQAAVVVMGAAVLFFWWQAPPSPRKQSYVHPGEQQLAQNL